MTVDKKKSNSSDTLGAFYRENGTEITVRKPMSLVNPPTSLLREHEIEIRVRYQETDAQGHVHHANFLNYFEIARVEMLRASGVSYRELEASGVQLVVTDAQCRYIQPAFYDDLLRVHTQLVRSKGVRITHGYTIRRDDEILVGGQTVVASIDHQGRVRRLPSWLRTS